MATRPTPHERLETYRSKRDFARSAEPAGPGGAPPAPAEHAPSFVVQRHRARALHYDVRLEVAGVLVSWAVPKGPTLDPKARRLAVRTEDHPMEYADFEGVIPRGEYGGGDVIVWDRGTWELHGAEDALAAVHDGEVHAELFGEKLAGRFVFIRTGPAGGRSGNGKEQWLLLHKNDDHAVAGWDAEEHPASVRSGRTNDEVAADPEASRDADAVAQLEAADERATMELDGHDVRLSGLDAEVLPGRGRSPAITTRDLVRHALACAPQLLAHLGGRTAEVLRLPKGLDGRSTAQRTVPASAPAWVGRAAPDGDGRAQLVVDGPATLAWLAGRAGVELRAATATRRSPGRPIVAVIAIEPAPGAGTDAWDDVLVVARLHRTALERLGVVGVPLLTGLGGIEVRVPMPATRDHDDVRAWAETVAGSVQQVVPDLVRPAGSRTRRGRVRLDVGANAAGAMLAVPYSPRPAPGAPVVTPLRWDELDDPDLRPDRWTIRTIAERLAGDGDPAAALLRLDQALPPLT